jgi:uncharacterized protein with HEPN domain
MRDDDRVRIVHMIEAAESALSFVHDRERADLDRDRMLLFGVVRAIEVIGEAAANVSQDTRTEAPAIPCPAIVSMRNRLIHAYFDIDHDIVWKTVTEEIPALLPSLRALLAEA